MSVIAMLIHSYANPGDSPSHLFLHKHLSTEHGFIWARFSCFTPSSDPQSRHRKKPIFRNPIDVVCLCVVMVERPMLSDVCVVILLFSSTLVGRKYTLTTSKVDVVIVVLIGFDALL